MWHCKFTQLSKQQPMDFSKRVGKLTACRCLLICWIYVAIMGKQGRTRHRASVFDRSPAPDVMLCSVLPAAACPMNVCSCILSHLSIYWLAFIHTNRSSNIVNEDQKAPWEKWEKLICCRVGKHAEKLTVQTPVVLDLFFQTSQAAD